MDGFRGGGESFLWCPFHKNPWHRLSLKFLLEPSVHLMTDLFAIAKSVLNERDLISCQNVKIAPDSGRLGSDGFRILPAVIDPP